ncbi:hypothetical protein DTL42_25430 [Bremerella cremea]|uniref:DUF3106 domain-containing protein n=1 Tax=Bremerella cremea TaxID=1031537 RepID=A0A368KJP0_9BACT|nr:hypothetical protein [Bremerella cremea]RCS40709.1 hypothetical protein DTL42_25430 [Bremerella cremea]
MNRSAILAGFVTLVLLTTLVGHAQESESERAARIAAMSDADKLSLRNKLERFERLPTAERERLLNLNAELEQRPDGPELRELMHRYYDWLKTINSGQRQELQELPAQERIAKIKSLLDEQERGRFFALMKNIMTDVKHEELDDIHQWIVDDWLVKDRDRILAYEEKLYEHKPWLRSRLAEKSLSPNRKVYDLWVNMYGVPGIPDIMPSESDFEELKSHLGEKTRKKLESEPDRQQSLLVQLMRAAIVSQFRTRVDDEDLKKFYAELPEKDKAELAGFPPERFNFELRKRYREENGRRFVGNRPPGPPPWDRDNRRGDGRGPEGRGPGMRGERGPRPPMPSDDKLPPTKPEEKTLGNDEKPAAASPTPDSP